MSVALYRTLDRNLKVLHAYRTYFPDSQGGLEEVIRQICLNTKPFDVESRVMSLSDSPVPPVLNRDEAQIHRFRKSFEVASCGFSLAAAHGFRRLVDWADVVHYHYPWPFADMLHLASGVTKPSLVTYHSDIVRQRLLKLAYAPLMHRFLGRVNRIICTSPNYFETSEVLQRFRSQVELIPIGLNESTYPSPSDGIRAATEQRFGRDFFVFVGVLRYYKGLHIALDAIRGAPYKVVIAGSGPTESELRRQAERLHLDNVVFAGHVSDQQKMALLDLSRCVIFPSYQRSEAFGVTLLEGAMRMRPLISTEVGSGTSHVNVHGVTGIVVPPGSALALRKAMDLIWHQPAMGRQLGLNARQRFEELFTGQRMGERYNSVYRRLNKLKANVTESAALGPT